MQFAEAMVIAMALDLLLGWPAALFARVGHPVTWLGRLIDVLDDRWNRDDDPPRLRRLAGIVAVLVVSGLAGALGLAVQSVFGSGRSGVLLVGILSWPFVASRSLYHHVAAVARPLSLSDVAGARQAVSMIVGRDPAKLDAAGIARAAIESLAENTSDGVVAPLLFGLLFGLPGIVGYKAVNTLDSMIGHRSVRHEAFGWAAARLDDVVNFLPARLTGLLFALGAAHGRQALSCMMSDARRHRSINAGWPEAAVAGALSVRLCGPRTYHGVRADEPFLNARAPDPGACDVGRALKLYVRAIAALGALLVVLSSV